MSELDRTTTATNAMRVSGVLDGDAALRLRPRLEALAATDGDVAMDLRDVSFIDGSGVAAIAFLYKRMTHRGRRLRVAASGQPLAMLRELGVAPQLGLSAGPVRNRGFAALRWGSQATRVAS